MPTDSKTSSYLFLIFTVLVTQAVTGFANYRVNSTINDAQYIRQKALSDYQKKQQVCSLLAGNKIMTVQLADSQRSAELDYKMLSTMMSQQNPPNQVLIDDWKRSGLTKDQLIVDLAKSRRELFEILATIEILFTRNGEVGNLSQIIAKVKNITLPGTDYPTTITNITELGNFTNRAKHEFAAKMEIAVAPIDELQKYLESEIRKEMP